MPAAKTPNVDAQRILSVMDELKEKFTYLSVCTPEVLGGLQSDEGQAVQELMGPELMKLLQEQTKLEELFVLASANAGRPADRSAEHEEIMHDEEQSLKKNTLELCRKMRQKQRAAPNLVPELRNFQDRDATRNVVQFLHTLNDLQDLTSTRLTTTVEEERSRAEALEIYKAKEAEASKRRQHLDKNLGVIHRHFDQAKVSQTETLMKLRAEHLDVKEFSDDRMAELRNRYDARMQDHQATFEAKTDKLQQEIQRLREQGNKVRAANMDDELEKTMKAKRHTMDVETAVKEYDVKMVDLAFQHGERQKLHNQEKKQLQELALHFEKVHREKAAIKAEESIGKARGAKRDREIDRRKLASALVQAFWRGILQREAYGALKKAKKKKGGGKKK